MSVQTDPAHITIADWSLNVNNNVLSRENTRVQLENKQSQLLAFLASRPGENLTKSELLQQVWNKRVVTEDVLYVCIAHLRKALGDNSRNPSYIKTIPGVGYKLLIKPDKSPVSPGETAEKQALASKTTPIQEIAPPGKVPPLSESSKHTVSENKRTIFSLKGRRSVFWPLITGLILILFLAAAYMSGSKPSFFSADTNNPDNISHSSPVPASIREDYQKARYLLFSDNPQPSYQAKAIQLLQHAITLEPGFSPAYALLGELKYLQFQQDKKEKFYQEAQSLINNALELDTANKAAHLTQANMSFWQAWDFPRAQHHYQKARGEGAADHLYAQFLLSQGKYKLARQYSQQYISANPNAYSRPAIAWIYTMAREYEKGYQELMKLAPFQQESFDHHVSLQAIHELQGQEQKAAEQLFWLMARAGYKNSTITEQRQRFTTVGLSGLYHWLAFEDKQQYNLGQYTPPLSLARYAIGAGDHARALELLQQAVNQRQYQVLWLKVDPKYDAIRHQEQFQQLLAQIGL
ncbi:winged helix-turn-helix domain-containing protein [Thalassomonas actiniarum]|uniref:Winged helix-turn-helix domain-containing protein n=1 Tax=Thalassomonas actiniarum TaxID=485447 RepID=A0AAE9YP99_9GAMM|nr:transcriptional regulator [Thalassomonas actiniarum]WDD97031.1 winged helix-turn-helix domain-containing protein [Thalassomonas actiniarum]